MKFWSKEWMEAIKEKSQVDKDYLGKTKGWSTKFYWVQIGAPDGVDKSMEFHLKDGKIEFANQEEKPAPSDLGTRAWDQKEYLIRGVGPYVAWKRVHTGEWTMMQMLGAGTTVMEGNTQALMTNMTPFMAFLDLVASVPAEY